MLLKNIVIYMAGTVGLEPTSTESKSVMLPITSYPNMTALEGLEPLLT